jgi:hypothetical protein
MHVIKNQCTNYVYAYLLNQKLGKGVEDVLPPLRKLCLYGRGTCRGPSRACTSWPSVSGGYMLRQSNRQQDLRGGRVREGKVSGEGNYGACLEGMRRLPSFSHACRYCLALSRARLHETAESKVPSRPEVRLLWGACGQNTEVIRETNRPSFGSQGLSKSMWATNRGGGKISTWRGPSMAILH